MGKIRVCIVDDSLTMRAMLGQMLDGDRGIEVIGVVADAGEAYQFIRNTRPDVVTMDVTHSGLDGIALLEKVVVERRIPVVMLSMDPDNCRLVDEALHLGAVACFDKRELTTNTAGLIRLVKKAATVKLRPRVNAFA